MTYQDDLNALSFGSFYARHWRECNHLQNNSVQCIGGPGQVVTRHLVSAIQPSSRSVATRTPSTILWKSCHFFQALSQL